jgi:predicted small metal-binding protein
MKKLTCRDLGGPCDTELTGDSFQEIGKKSYDHVMEQINTGDEAHKLAADKMRNATPEQQKDMMAEFEKRFNEAPNM